MKKESLTTKRQHDKGSTDYEIIEDILDHEGIELIKFSDPNLDSEFLVSSTNRIFFVCVQIHLANLQEVVEVLQDIIEQFESRNAVEKTFIFENSAVE